METARKWMHEMGFVVLTARKGSYVDGHERDDVVEYRKKFLQRMVALGFLKASNALKKSALQALPADLECPHNQSLTKLLLFMMSSFSRATRISQSFGEPKEW